MLKGRVYNCCFIWWGLYMSVNNSFGLSLPYTALVWIWGTRGRAKLQSFTLNCLIYFRRYSLALWLGLALLNWLSWLLCLCRVTNLLSLASEYDMVAGIVYYAIELSNPECEKPRWFVFELLFENDWIGFIACNWYGMNACDWDSVKWGTLGVDSVKIDCIC